MQFALSPERFATNWIAETHLHIAFNQAGSRATLNFSAADSGSMFFVPRSMRVGEILSPADDSG